MRSLWVFEQFRIERTEEFLCLRWGEVKPVDIEDEIKAMLDRENYNYSDNNLKSSQFLKGALSKFKDNELKKIKICYIGNNKYSKGIEVEAQRVGVQYTNIFKFNK